MKPLQAWVIGILLASCLVYSGVLAWHLGWNTELAVIAPVEPLRLRLGVPELRDGVMQQAVERFVREVERHSQGRVIVTVMETGSLSEAEQLISLARMGQREMVLLPLSMLGQLLPGFRIMDVPFLFSSPQSLHQFLDGETGRLLLQQMVPLDLVGLSFWEEGFRQMVGRRAVDAPDDLKKMRFGVVPGGFSSNMFAGYGAIPVEGRVASGGEHRFSDKVDGWETLLTRSVLDQKGDQPLFVTLSHHGWQGAVLAMGGQGYHSLPVNIFPIIRSSAQEVMLWTRKQSGLQLQRMEQAMTENKVTVQRMTGPTRGSWMLRARKWVQGYEETLGPGLLAAMGELEMERAGGAAGNNGWIIGLDADLSGSLSGAGLAIKRGVQLAIDEINASGGVLGKPLNLIVTDNRGSVALGVANAMRLGQKWGAVALVAGGNDPVIAEQVPVTKNQKMLLLVPWGRSVEWMGNSRDDDVERRHVFRLAANEYQGSMVLFDDLVHTPGKIALMLENTGNGRNFRAIMIELFKDHSREKPAVVWFNVGQKVFLDPLSQLQEAGVTSLLLMAGPEETRYIRANMETLAFKARILAFQGDPVTRAGENGISLNQGDSFLQTFSLDLQWDRTPVGDALRKRYWNLFEAPPANHIPNPSATAQAYDLVFLLAKALQRVPEGRGGTGLDVAMERLEAHQGAIKNYSWPFSHIRHEGLAPSDVILVQFNDEGMLVPRGTSRK
ncbi:MAG: TRAP transporter substrate-binding protein DctP [Magnetococcales bacterium]|nr:TRAP transporter substrate-binding protein DctP [Magnetococcales bacterium]